MALLFERYAGYPAPVLRRIGHPVMWIGSVIATLDSELNKPEFTPQRRRMHGVVALVIIVLLPAVCALVAGWVVGWILPLGIAWLALLASSLLAQKSLAQHVEHVASALETGSIEAGREAVSMIVGRDPEKLDEAAVSRAAIESLAENFSDGVVAPAFWLGVGGLPGGAAYKAVNTADSMIGHLTDRHRDFGWASARLDDLINLPASRLTALLLVAAALVVPGASAGRACRALWRDAGKHRSPNAGWPEAAMAGALGLALAGPRIYGGVTVDDAVMGEGGRREASAADIRAALRLYHVADGMLVAVFATLAAAVLLA